jgi:hypothetical protein
MARQGSWPPAAASPDTPAHAGRTVDEAVVGADALDAELEGDDLADLVERRRVGHRVTISPSRQAVREEVD